ncbi:hypothetical protein VCV18_011484 [Metarhizium anisopliae]
MAEETKASPKGYRHLALGMLHRGQKPRLDLPHEDDQESVRWLMARNRAFLEGSEGPAIYEKPQGVDTSYSSGSAQMMANWKLSPLVSRRSIVWRNA